MNPMPRMQTIDRDSIVGGSNPQSTLSICGRIGIRQVANHEMDPRGAGRILDYRPEIASEIVEQQRSDFVKIETEAHLTSRMFERLRKPLGYRECHAGRSQCVYELGLRRECSRKRFNDVDNRQCAVALT